MAKNDYVTASELGDYVYCKRSWWLKLMGYTASNYQMIKGSKDHDSFNKGLDKFALLKIIFLSIIAIGAIIITLLVGYIFLFT